MNSQRLARILFLAILATGWACNDDDDIEPVNRLQADAGSDQEVVAGDVVHLDGSNSSEGDDLPFEFRWTFKTKPTHSSAILNDAATPTPYFTADVTGLFEIQLTVRHKQFSKTDVVSILARDADNGPSTVQISEDITSDKVLSDIFDDPATPDYLVTEDVSVKAKLTVLPGVVVAFEADKSLEIFPEGILIARGTSLDRIYFTGKEKQTGFWKGIVIHSNNANNELDNVSVEFGGSNPLPEMGAIKSNIALSGTPYSGAALRISNSTVIGSGGYGLYAGGRSHLNYFYANYFRDNAGSAVFVPAAELHSLDFFTHYADNNGYNGVETGGTVNAQEEVRWSYFNDGAKYLVTQDLIIESGVSVTEGAIFEFAANVGVKVMPTGYLNATGTDFKPVVFTAHAKTQDTFWKGIYIASSSTLNKLLYTTISYAGASQMPGMPFKANVAVAAGGNLTVKNSTFEKGLGWGLVGETGSYVNQDAATINLFDDFVDGYFKLPFSVPATSLTGVWVDSWSFQRGYLTVADNFYSTTTGSWFDGAPDPWHMTPATGFGLHIKEDGSYVWTIADQSTWTGECVSYSAEFILGNIQSTDSQITFNEAYWRSKFYTSCDPQQNVDVNVETGTMTLNYEINKMYNLFSGAEYWELKIFNPDNSFFTYYKY